MPSARYCVRRESALPVHDAVRWSVFLYQVYREQVSLFPPCYFADMLCADSLTILPSMQGPSLLHKRSIQLACFFGTEVGQCMVNSIIIYYKLEISFFFSVLLPYITCARCCLAIRTLSTSLHVFFISFRQAASIMACGSVFS